MIKVLLKHTSSGKVAFGILGFSWTTLFFGMFVALFRKDFKAFFFIFFLQVLCYYFFSYFRSYFSLIEYIPILFYSQFYFLFSSFYGFIINILGAFFYNRLYTEGLVKKGYYPVSEEGKILLKMHHIECP